MGSGPFLASTAGQNFKAKICPLMSPQELIKLNPETFLEMRTNVSQHIRLSRCSEAANGGQEVIACVLANEA
ncbi:hypothetical protein D9M68_900760 [compost metagenome]